MKDLTQGSIASHILTMAPPIVVGMVTIMVCQLVDLYFVSDLGEAAVAGVAAAGNAGFLINGLMQVLGVGTVALISHAVGRKDKRDANLIFNQGIVLAVLWGCSRSSPAPCCRAPICVRSRPIAPPSRPARRICCGSCRPWHCNSSRR